MVAIAALILPNPSGAKIQQIAPPMIPKILLSSSISGSNTNAPSTNPKTEPAHIRIDERRIIVPAFLINELARSHMERNTFPAVGQWYAGSSITNGAGSPANILVFFSMIPEIITAAIPTKYALGATHHAPPNRAAAIRAIIGSFAPHGINVVVIIVIRRSRSFSIVLEAMTPGTPHPVPISIGIKDLPDKPNLRNTLSSTNAILDI